MYHSFLRDVRASWRYADPIHRTVELSTVHVLGGAATTSACRVPPRLGIMPVIITCPRLTEHASLRWALAQHQEAQKQPQRGQRDGYQQGRESLFEEV